MRRRDRWHRCRRPRTEEGHMKERKSDEEVFWPSMFEAKPPAPAKAPARSIVGSVPVKSDPEILYPRNFERAVESQIGHNLSRLQDGLNLTTAQADALRQQHLGWLKTQTGGGPTDDAVKLHNLVTQYSLKPPADAEVEQWGQAANQR